MDSGDMEFNRRTPPNAEVTGARHTVLGEMHDGRIRVEETHPLLKKLVRLAIFVNIGCLLALWMSFRIKNLFPPYDAPFMNAIGWYFFFGAMYGVFAQSLYSLGRYREIDAVIKAVTPNRRYEFHTRYDTSSLQEEDLKKTADAKMDDHATGRHEVSPAVGVGGKIYFYAGMFALCAFGSCSIGVNQVFTTLF